MTDLLQGSDNVRVWNIETSDQLRILNQNYGLLEQDKKCVRDFP
jgi:hypothetical protein